MQSKRTNPTRRRCGFSLVELLIVVALMGVMAGMIIPSASAPIYDQLHSAAQIVGADLAYARSLAVMNNSTYRISFSASQNRCVLQHTGASSALNTLPPSPYRSSSDPANQHITDMDEMPRIGSAVRLVDVHAMSTTPARVSNVEFGPLGQTTRSEETVLWFTAGEGTDQRYLSLSVNPVTGLTSIGNLQATAPPAATGPALP